MMSSNRNLLVLFKNGFTNEKEIEQEMDCISEILFKTDTLLQFCMAHELVDRNRITTSHKKIVKASRFYRLRPFRFLINKN